VSHFLSEFGRSYLEAGHPPEDRRGHVGAARGAGQSAAAAGWAPGEAGVRRRQQSFDRFPVQPGNPEGDRAAGFFRSRSGAVVAPGDADSPPGTCTLGP
jgi:hypothetical protein